MAAAIPVAPNNMVMTTIWYFAAISGDTPDNTCPVIIPGKDTRPTANSALTIGIIAVLKAVRRACSHDLPVSSSAASRSAAMLIAVIAPEKIIPANGTT